MKNETKSLLRDILIAIFIIATLVLAINIFSAPHTIPVTEEPGYITYDLPVTEAYNDFLD